MVWKEKGKGLGKTSLADISSLVEWVDGLGQRRIFEQKTATATAFVTRQTVLVSG